MLLRLATDNAETNLWPNVHALPEWEKGGEYPGVHVALLPSLLLTVRVCIMCKAEGGDTEGLVLLFYELGL